MTTLKEQIEIFLKTGWRSNFEMQQYVRSASADGIARKIRQNPPLGYAMQQRPRRIDGYRPCLEYRLIPTGQMSLFNTLQ